MKHSSLSVASASGTTIPPVFSDMGRWRPWQAPSHYSGTELEEALFTPFFWKQTYKNILGWHSIFLSKHFKSLLKWSSSPIEWRVDGQFQVSFILLILQRGRLRQGDEFACNSTHSRTIKVRIDWCPDFQLQDRPVVGVLESFSCSVPRHTCLQDGFLVPATIWQKGNPQYALVS